MGDIYIYIYTYISTTVYKAEMTSVCLSAVRHAGNSVMSAWIEVGLRLC